MYQAHFSMAVQARFALLAAFMYAGMALSATLMYTDAQLIDRIKGGMLAKSTGNRLAGPAEQWTFDANRVVNTLSANSICDCGDDDIDLQIPFAMTMSAKMGGPSGIYSATMQDYGNAFKLITRELWVGNAATMNALKGGINPPYSGGWPLNGAVKNGQCEAIDWQIESQWIGFVTPGLPATCAKIDSICGHVVSYANGYYAALLFLTASSIAPLYNDIHTIIQQANAALPPGCDIHKNTDTLIWYHNNNPTKTWIDAYNWAFGKNGQAAHALADWNTGGRTNAICVVIALLYSDNNIENAALLAYRMGEDTDCNGGDACAILGSMLGYTNLPAQWKTLFEQAMASRDGCAFTGVGISGLTFKSYIDSTVAIAKKAILQSGGAYANGTWTIPVQDVPAPRWFEKYGQNPVFIGTTPVARNASEARTGRLTVRVAANAGKAFSARFTVPEYAAGKTLTIELLDTRGRLVGTPVEGVFSPGSHIVNLPRVRDPAGGHYLARIRTGGTATAMVCAPMM
jgi:hypothetical protein